MSIGPVHVVVVLADVVVVVDVLIILVGTVRRGRDSMGM